MFKLNIEKIREQLDPNDEKLIDGKGVARGVRAEVAKATALLLEKGIIPKLSVVLVGDDPASQVYVKHKVRACEQTGIASELVRMPATSSQAEVIETVDRLANDDDVDGILVQFPLPADVDEIEVVSHIPEGKDVDGFTNVNLGLLMAWRSVLEPCTPHGIMTMMRVYGIDPKGKRALVVGRSMVVGRPMAQMLVRADATVTVAHRHTKDLATEVENSDIVVVATGVANLIPGQWFKPGAVVFDVGINRTESGKLIGDVVFEDAYPRVAKITPVPGGVGPMTVASLLENTIRAACVRRGVDIDVE